MSQRCISRRHFLGASALGAMGGASVLVSPAQAAAEAVGVKPADLPDLTIKEVKVYVADIRNVRRLNSPESGEICSIVTNGGVEGNYTLGNRGATPGWVDYAKSVCLGKSAFDILLALGNAPTPPSGGRGGGAGRGGGRAGGGGSGGGGGGGPRPNLHAAAIDICLWDIIGKALNRPTYKLLAQVGGGGNKDKILAYASSQHLPTVEDYVPDMLKAKAEGFKAYKIHPGGGQHATGAPVAAADGHIDEIKSVRKAAGDDYTLLFDPVQRYNLPDALKVGRVLIDQGYINFEDPVPTTNIEGLIELRKQLPGLPLEIGEFILSVHGFRDYIQRGALDIVRLIADNVGGISGSMKVGILADCMGFTCTPHNWGNVLDLAVHFQLELALPNCRWFEMPQTPDFADRAYMKDKIRPDKDGYVIAPTAPGLGYPIDHDALDKMLIRIDR
jgi:L-alanine-DL-glutamate epimerase-like enolase superfamily enzyme